MGVNKLFLAGLLDALPFALTVSSGAQNAHAEDARPRTDTAPKGFEREKAFRRRVRNAVTWLNASRWRVLKRTVSSMPHRTECLLTAKGAMTPYQG